MPPDESEEIIRKLIIIIITLVFGLTVQAMWISYLIFQSLS